jgi:hypothetical protein
MRSMALLITDSSSLRDIGASLPRRLIEELVLSRKEPEGIHVEDATRRLAVRSLELLDLESLLGWNGMLQEGFGRRVEKAVFVVDARCV